MGETPEAPDWVNAALSFSPDGRWLATAGNDGRALVWMSDRLNNRPVAELLGHRGGLADVQFDPSFPSRLTTAGFDGTARIWQLPERTVLSSGGGRMLGEIEEAFIEGLVIGDTFVFGGEVVRYEALAEDQVYVSRANDADAKVPSYMGGKFPLSTYLAERVRKLLDDRRAWGGLPDQVRDWLSLQSDVSRVPGVRELLVETFPRGNKHYLVCYPFEGRLAHQTLGMLLTRRLERARARPLGFVANEYALAVWGLGDLPFMIRQGRLDLNALFDPDMLGDDLEAWLAESALMKRTFRTCAIISGLIARRFTGEEKTRRQVLFSTDLIYDVLRKHQPDHVLLRAARADAATGLLDIRRLSDMLSRIKGRIIHKELDHVSPLAVPVMLEIGRESVYGEASDELLAEAADELVKEAMS